MIRSVMHPAYHIHPSSMASPQPARPYRGKLANIGQTRLGSQSGKYKPAWRRDVPCKKNSGHGVMGNASDEVAL